MTRLIECLARMLQVLSSIPPPLFLYNTASSFLFVCYIARLELACNPPALVFGVLGLRMWPTIPASQYTLYIGSFEVPWGLWWWPRWRGLQSVQTEPGPLPSLPSGLLPSSVNLPLVLAGPRDKNALKL